MSAQDKYTLQVPNGSPFLTSREVRAMPHGAALRRWLVSTPMIVVLLVVACSTVTNTPAQDEAWRRWEACSSQVPGSDIRSVQLDGRIMFWANGPFQGRSMLDCLTGAGKDGPALPDAMYAIRPGGQ
jgi:hypothetical protein